MSWSCDYDNFPEFFSETVHVSRKERHCCECSAPILQGESYYACRGKWGGEFEQFPQHLLCRDNCVWLRDKLNGECIYFGGLSEWWDDSRRNIDMTEDAWRIGVRMFAMVRRRERLARSEVSGD